MPSLFSIGSYRIYFWANESGEPVHVHVTTGVPSADATKLWLTKAGGCVLAHNHGRIPSKDLRSIEKIVAAQHTMICENWKRFFNTDTLSFIC